MKEITEREVEAIRDYLEFTEEQKKALTNLKKAFTRCRKLGLDFWDNYGDLTVFDRKKMSCPCPDDRFGFNLEHGENPIDCCVEIKEAGDVSGNADDPLLFDLRGKTLQEIMDEYYE